MERPSNPQLPAPSPASHIPRQADAVWTGFRSHSSAQRSLHILRTHTHWAPAPAPAFAPLLIPPAITTRRRSRRAAESAPRGGPTRSFTRESAGPPGPPPPPGRCGALPHQRQFMHRTHQHSGQARPTGCGTWPGAEAVAVVRHSSCLRGAGVDSGICHFLTSTAAASAEAPPGSPAVRRFGGDVGEGRLDSGFDQSETRARSDRRAQVARKFSRPFLHQAVG